MCLDDQTSRVNCILCARFVGPMYAMFPRSVNPVGGCEPLDSVGYDLGYHIL